MNQKEEIKQYPIMFFQEASGKIPVQILYLGAAALGGICILPAAKSASAWRGYDAAGGEMLLPVLAVALVAALRFVLNMKNKYRKSINLKDIL